MNVETLENGQKTVLNLVKSSSDYMARLPLNTYSVLEDLKELRLALNDLQVRCKLECLEVERKYLDLQRPLQERWKGLISGKLRPSNQATEDSESGTQYGASKIPNANIGVPNFWRTALSNHLLFHDLVDEHDQDVLTQLIDIRVEHLSQLDPNRDSGYRILFEFSPNDYFENSILSKTYRYDRSRLGSSGDFVYLSATGTEIKWKKGMDLILRVDGSYRGSFFEFFTPLTKGEIEEAVVDDEWLEVLKDDIEHDYQLGAALKDEILPRAFDWFTGRLLAEACTSTPNAEDAEKMIGLHSPKHRPKYGYEAILHDASTDLAHSLLLSAAKHGHVSALKLLLGRADIDVNWQDDEGRTLLYIAARDGQEAIVKLLITQDHINVNSPTSGGSTPLHVAAQNGHGAVVNILVTQNGVDLNSRTKLDGATPFYLAALNGREAVVRLLVSHNGIDINSSNNDGATPLHVAAQNGHGAVVNILVKQNSVDLNARTKLDGATPLYFAAEDGHEAVVKLLVCQNGIDINSPRKHGATPLCIAAHNGHEAVVKVLISVDGINLRSGPRGATPYSYAVAKGHTGIAALLEQAGGPRREHVRR